VTLGRDSSWWGVPLVALGLGCSIAPKSFKGLNNPAPITRARAMGLGNRLPEQRAIPPMLDRLHDVDPVVRLTAHEELRRRTGRDFGYVPWAEPTERARAESRWRSWWNARQAGLAKRRPIP
jgi:hypothetical protein